MGLGYGWKILILCGFIKNPVYKGGHEKLIYRRELPKKGGETWQKRGWGVFEGGDGGGGDTPMHTMNLAITLTVILIYWCQCPRC